MSGNRAEFRNCGLSLVDPWSSVDEDQLQSE